jgi:hypothetical protein
LDKTRAQAGAKEMEVPRSWLQADIQDVTRKYLSEFKIPLEEQPQAARQFMDEVRAQRAAAPTASPHLALRRARPRQVRDALQPYVYELRRVYKTYEALGAGPGGGVGSGISMVEFSRFVKDCGLLQPGRGKGRGWQVARGAVALPTGEVDLLFRRCNVKAAASDRAAAKQALSFMEGAQGHLDGTTSEAKNDMEKQIDLISGVAEMSIQEWISGLIRLAWSCFGQGKGASSRPGTPAAAAAAAAAAEGATKLGIGRRITCLIQEAVMRGAAEHLNKADPMEAHLANRRVRAVLDFYAADFKQIFNSYAQADQGSAGSLQSLDTLNLNETLYMLKEAKLLDDSLTLLAVTNIFTAVNTSFEEDEENGDDDEAELCFDEFLQVFARMADAKHPAETRNGVPFEIVMQQWFHNAVVPEYKRLLAQKKRGVQSKTM